MESISGTSSYLWAYPMMKIEVIKHGVYRHYTKLDAGESTESLPDNNVLFFGLIADYKGLMY